MNSIVSRYEISMVINLKTVYVTITIFALMIELDVLYFLTKNYNSVTLLIIYKIWYRLYNVNNKMI